MKLKINNDFPVGNAAGWCKTIEEVEKLSRSTAQVILVGSFTIEPRSGNSGTVFNNRDLNSLGLPNGGRPYLKEHGKKMVEIAHSAGKLIFLSVAGLSVVEYAERTAIAMDTGFDGVEENLGCPNIMKGKKRKPIISFDVRLTEEILKRTTHHVRRSGRYFTVKVSPYSNPLMIRNFAKLFIDYEVNAIVTQNTFPNGLLFNSDGTPQIDVPNGWAGLAGPSVKAMSLGQVSQWRQALDEHGGDDIQVWRVGGVSCGRDIHETHLAGGSFTQVGTAYFVGGPKVFSEIADQYVNL